MLRPRSRRRRAVARRMSRRGRVRGGMVETVYSIVVGEGRRVCRWGAVVSIWGWLEEVRRKLGINFI